MMAVGHVGTVIKALAARIEAMATALVSRNGVVVFADLPAGVYSETFAIMCATIFGAAANANAELSRAPPERIVIEGNDSTTVIFGRAEKALLIAVVDKSADVTKVLAEVGKVAEILMAS
jgi:uncharacterized protein